VLVLLPQIFGHLRMDGINDPSAFLCDSAEDRRGACEMLNSLFDAIDQAGGDLSVRKCRELCTWKSVRVICCMIRHLLANLESPIIPEELCLRLMQRSQEFIRPFDGRADELLLLFQDIAAYKLYVI